MIAKNIVEHMGHEFEVAMNAAAEIDRLPPKLRSKAVAMIAAYYYLQLKRAPTRSGVDQDRGGEFVLSAVASAVEEIDRSPYEAHRKAVAILAANYDLEVKPPSATRPQGFRYGPARRRRLY